MTTKLLELNFLLGRCIFQGIFESIFCKTQIISWKMSCMRFEVGYLSVKWNVT